MIENQDILFDVAGQSLFFDAPEGRPSSVVSSAVFRSVDGDDATAELATTGSAAIETNPNTTFDAASGDGLADPTICNLAATTGIVRGRTYLGTTASGEREWIEVVDIVSAASVESRQPLVNAFANADTFQSTRITHAIDSTWIVDRDNVSAANDPSPCYRWRFVYVVDGVTYAQHRFFDVVRYSVGSTITGLDVDNAYPGWLNRIPTFHRKDQGAKLIKEAYRAVKLDMYQTGKADQMARNRELVEDLVLNKAGQAGIYAAAIAGAEFDQAIIELIDKKYMERFNNFLVTPKLKFDDHNDGGASQSHSSPLFRR